MLKGDEERRSDVGARDVGSGEWKLSMTGSRRPIYYDRIFTLWSAGQVETVNNQSI
jgi:hypothetical protein